MPKSVYGVQRHSEKLLGRKPFPYSHEILRRVGFFMISETPVHVYYSNINGEIQSRPSSHSRVFFQSWKLS